MKALFVNPPTWFNMFPPLPLPIIAGYLESLGHNTQVMDLNIDFIQYIFSEEFVNKFQNEFYSLEKEVTQYKEKKELPENLEKKIEIYNYIVDYAKKSGYEIDKTKTYCEMYEKVSKDKEQYFDSWALKIAHYKILIYNELLLKLQITSTDLFNEFFERSIEKILNVNADYIGFSMSDVDQFFYAIRIAKLLKKKTKTPICFGGTCINYFYDKKIENKESFHRNIADFLMFGSGELPHKDMAEYIDGKIPITKVRNIEYLDKNGKIQRNKTKIVETIPKYFTKYDDLDFSKYYSPQIVLSLETTKGCYWHRCAFCTRPTLHEGMQFRKVEDVVDDLYNLNEKFNVKYFHLMDDCIPIKYAENIANKIMEKNLNIYYMTFMRFEDNMTKEFFQKLYDSGLRLIIFGLESPDEKRLKYLNKGVKVETYKRILKECAEIGIKNHITLIADYPNETEEELNGTINFIKDFSDEIFFVQISQFQLLENTLMYNNPKKYNISEELIQRTKKNGYAKNSLDGKHEELIEEIGIKAMMRGAPPSCLYSTGGSLLYALRDEII